ncbi:DUF3429 domain-containing protein [Maricaulis sp.]|uniref:DUF3429 domain-containing protein n=1 Tax=Maricaulis sp. TaxID=1486257 RepID=UPI0025B8DC56|nr:DUF3429 domain-containing protein [Maricaulis sp.]
MSTPASRLTITLWLGLAGWIPFWLPVGLATQAVLSGRSAAAETALFIVYGAIILGFLGGVRWGHAMARAVPASALTYGLSVLPSLAGLAAVIAYWAGAVLPGISLVLIGLVLHWRWDRHATRSGSLPHWYGRLRSLLTLGAALAALGMLGLYAASV